ncbi:MAG: 5-(carboxyamino)imidazole ribonucleotide synthase, partial [Spirulinaceae cyanobacterium]
MSLKRVGVIGGGQLAGMMAAEAEALGIELVVQTPDSQDPAVAVANEVIYAPVDDAVATAKLATHCQSITFENEFINLAALSKLAQEGICFRPSLEALAPLLDKYKQRLYLKKIGLPVPKFILLESGQEITSPFGFPAVLKTRRNGYDGKGTFIVKNLNDLKTTWESRECPDILLEEFVPFNQELAVMAARSLKGEIVIYPIVETQQVNQVCRRVIAPAQINPELVSQIQAIATTLLEKLQVVGIFGIELFLTEDQQVLVNEIAPRTHNSGHFTLDA